MAVACGQKVALSYDIEHSVERNIFIQGDSKFSLRLWEQHVLEVRVHALGFARD